MKIETENRIMYFELPEREVLHIALPFDCWRRVADVNLPNDVRLLSVHHDPIKRSFLFVIHSNTYDEVAPGCVAPRLELNIQLKELKLEEQGDNP